MRVVYSIGSRLAGGGIGDTAYHAARGLERAGCLQRLFCLGYEPSDIPPGRITSLWFPPRRFLRLPPLHYYWLKDRSYDRRVARRLPDSLEVFHGWNSHSLASLAAARERGALAFIERGSMHPVAQARLLVEEHERLGLPSPPAMDKLVDRCVAECEAADFVHVPSSLCAQSFVAEGFPADKLVQSPYGVELARFTATPPPDQFTVLFVGAIGVRKGALDLLEAWRLLGLSDSRLVLLGGPERELEPRLADLRPQCSFETPGFTPDVAAAYAAASVLVLPAIEDGYPLVVLEAMASGRPVIVSENTGSKDAVDEGVNGFVVPIRSPEAIAEKLAWLHGHPAECAQMGCHARRRAEELPWERHGESLVAAYEDALR